MANYEKPFDVMALDENYNLAALVVYNKLQWNRKCLEAGIFSIELSVDQYKKEWCYVYSPSRRELGRITQVNMSLKKNVETVTISGKFIEDDLNRMVVYPRPTHFYASSTPHTSIVDGSPDWLSRSGTADQVASAFFDAFKSITYMGYDIEDSTGQNLKERTYTLDIVSGIIDTEHGTYHRSTHSRNGEELGHKISLILKPSYAFYEVNYDYETNVKTFDIKHGRDLTSGNTEGNNPIVFSTKNGTISEAGVVRSITDTKDIVVSYTKGEDEVIVLVNGYDEATGKFVANENLPSVSDYDQDLDYRLAVRSDAASTLSSRQDKLNLTFKIFNGSYEYMIDFDIGDVVTVSVPELDFDVNVQIIGCYETVQNGVWDLDLEFGTPIKRR